MKKDSMTLAVTENRENISLDTVREWLLANNKKRLAQFIYDRLYGRYIRPFDYPSEEYRIKYKNGFTIMTNCCLLIETYMSWTEQVYKSTDKKSERCFIHFFKMHESFKDFDDRSQSIKNLIDLNRGLDHKGIACDFYHNVRCALLHNGETKNGWRITRSGPLYDDKTKSINSVAFMSRLKAVLKAYRASLEASDFHHDRIWITFKNRLTVLLKTS